MPRRPPWRARSRRTRRRKGVSQRERRSLRLRHGHYPPASLALALSNAQLVVGDQRPAAVGTVECHRHRSPPRIVCRHGSETARNIRPGRSRIKAAGPFAFDRPLQHGISCTRQRTEDDGKTANAEPASRRAERPTPNLAS